jgi:HPt (histidine-containing phosphotransfer) domain-containing protein
MDDSFDDVVRRMWLEQRTTALGLADELATLARQEDPTADALVRGHRAAHQLAGSLGMYGIPEGSEIASLLEDHLSPEGARSIPPDVFVSLTARLRQLVVDGPVTSAS